MGKLNKPGTAKTLKSEASEYKTSYSDDHANEEEQFIHAKDEKQSELDTQKENIQKEECSQNAEVLNTIKGTGLHKSEVVEHPQSDTDPPQIVECDKVESII